MPYGDCICEVPGCIGPCVTRAKLPQLTNEEKLALNKIPDDAVSHWVQGEKWDFEKEIWIRPPE